MCDYFQVIRYRDKYARCDSRYTNRRTRSRAKRDLRKILKEI